MAYKEVSVEEKCVVKKVIFLIVFALIMSVGFADPFGLKMGMTLEEIKEKCG